MTLGGMNKRLKIPPEKITRWLDLNFPDAKKRKLGVEYVVINPLKPNQEKPRLNINTETGGCHDWTGDEWAGAPNPKTGKRPCNIVRLIQLMRGCSYRQALEELLGSSVHLYYTGKPEEKEEKEELQEVPLEIPLGYKPLLGPDDFFSARVHNYLIKRGYTHEQIIKENIHYRGPDMLWLYTEFGELVYMQSRNVVSKKFWFPPNEIKNDKGDVIGKLEVTKEDVLYGFDDVPKSNYVIITESIFNKVSLGVHCVATGGAAMCDGQIKRLKFLNPQHGVILAPDNDKAGLESIIANGDLLLEHGFKAYWSIPPRVLIGVDENGKDRYVKDWNELYTHLGFNNDQIIETMNKTLVPYSLTAKIKIRSALALGPKK